MPPSWLRVVVLCHLNGAMLVRIGPSMPTRGSVHYELCVIFLQNLFKIDMDLIVDVQFNVQNIQVSFPIS
jgi:hypothetical protein